MKTFIKSVTFGALGSAAWLLLGAGNLLAQDRSPQGNFDPAQMRQRMLERMRDQMEVKDDTEWKAISERIEQVMQARREMGGSPGGPGGPGGMGAPGGRGGPGGPGGFGSRSRAGGPPQAGQDGLPPQDGPGGPPPQDRRGGRDQFGPPNGGPEDAPSARQGGFSGRGGMRGGPGGFGGPGGMGREQNPEMEALRKALDSDAPASEIKAKLAELRAARKKKQADLEKAQAALKDILSTRQEAVAVTLGLLQ